MTPIDKYELTPEEQKGTLQYLMFLKEKSVGPSKDVDAPAGDPSAAT